MQYNLGMQTKCCVDKLVYAHSALQWQPNSIQCSNIKYNISCCLLESMELLAALC
jgi:hypothetical protein